MAMTDQAPDRHADDDRYAAAVSCLRRLSGGANPVVSSTASKLLSWAPGWAEALSSSRAYCTAEPAPGQLRDMLHYVHYGSSTPVESDHTAWLMRILPRGGYSRDSVLAEYAGLAGHEPDGDLSGLRSFLCEWAHMPNWRDRQPGRADALRNAVTEMTWALQSVESIMGPRTADVIEDLEYHVKNTAGCYSRLRSASLSFVAAPSTDGAARVQAAAGQLLGSVPEVITGHDQGRQQPRAFRAGGCVFGSTFPATRWALKLCGEAEAHAAAASEILDVAGASESARHRAVTALADGDAGARWRKLTGKVLWHLARSRRGRTLWL